MRDLDGSVSIIILFHFALDQAKLNIDFLLGVNIDHQSNS